MLLNRSTSRGDAGGLPEAFADRRPTPRFAHGLDFAGKLNVQRFAAGLRFALAAMLIGRKPTNLIELAHHVAEQPFRFLPGAFDALDAQGHHLSQ